MLIQLIAIIAGGVVIFAIARTSRKSYESKYCKPSSKEKLKFTLIFLSTLLVILTIVTLYSFTTVFLVVTVILGGYLGILDTEPGVCKDIIYSAMICSLIAGFSGLLVYGM